MLLEKPQKTAVERVLTDVYDTGRNKVLEAVLDYAEKQPTDEKSVCVAFVRWYLDNASNYDMQFKVSDK